MAKMTYTQAAAFVHRHWNHLRPVYIAHVLRMNMSNEFHDIMNAIRVAPFVFAKNCIKQVGERIETKDKLVKLLKEPEKEPRPSRAPAKPENHPRTRRSSTRGK